MRGGVLIRLSNYKYETLHVKTFPVRLNSCVRVSVFLEYKKRCKLD